MVENPIEHSHTLPPERRQAVVARILNHYNAVLPETYQLDILQVFIMKLEAEKIASEPMRIVEDLGNQQPPQYLSFFGGQFELTRALSPLDVINVTLDFWWGTSTNFRDEIEFLKKQYQLYEKSIPTDKYTMKGIDLLVSIREKILKKRHTQEAPKRAREPNATILQHS